MMEDNEKNAMYSLNIIPLLGVAFIILKLCHVIDWSWWLVTLPFWGGIALVLAILGLIGVFLLIMHILSSIEDALKK